MALLERFNRVSLKKRPRFSSIMGCVNGKSFLTDEDIVFIARNTAMDQEQVEIRYQNFLSKHPDGRISRKSFHDMMKECYPGTDTEKLEKHIFRMYDTNDDGHIDFREFMIVLYVLSNGSPEENLKQIFRVFDINNDGSISLKELKRIVKDLFHLINEENVDQASHDVLANSAFSEMDENKDGEITQEEFIEACMLQKKFSTMLTLRIIDIFVAE
ncbi:neuronal calcium sensor 2 [Eurytemora carolleeae]|uniref:neuronal calcium sensor 2 n=1 Tax=Eurytemora carolleeae TaxID=1294199 RepID=UPI000C78CE06|nr:neuronal calcium sensor 2 [Eurytemora carolleeae]|eukprot:XP_023345061.1 neuronal calcium sensor 2-like [Eurytemora affinis]